MPPGASFEWGVATEEIHGSVAAEPGSPPLEDPLIVVYKQHHTLMPRYGPSVPGAPVEPDQEGGQTHPSAHVYPVVPPGLYSFDVPPDVVSVYAMFIAAGRVTRTFRFSRSVGVGRVRFEARLPETAGWRDHFYTFLVPQLEHLIVEPRYRLSNREQKILADWLERRQGALAAPRPSGGARNPRRG